MMVSVGQSGDPGSAKILKLAILAVGGQGGGVLTGWIERMARASDYAVQATSVAGVAQRTGATVYYIEMTPQTGREPVFSLMPGAGDVDILIAAEMMEAGRAIMRGFVTPDRTVLIASDHRALAISEKTAPADGIASGEEVRSAAELASRRFICADFDAAATDNGSVISASLFGALAASETLPFPRSAFEDAVRATGGGARAEASLRAFAAGFEAAQGEPAQSEQDAPRGEGAVAGPPRQMRAWQALTERLSQLPGGARPMAEAGLRKLVAFQDTDYGGEYLDRLETIAERDRGGGALTREAAKYLANAMAYDDIIRVADAKTRLGRYGRIGREMGADGAPVRITEFLHPRAEEIVAMLPAAMGARWAANPRRMATLDRWFNRGRYVRTDRLLPFFVLYVLGGLRRWRRKTLRHAEEMAHIDVWLARAMEQAGRDDDLAIEILRCQRLIKGYSDTHSRGRSKFARVMDGIGMIAGREDAADWARRLREMALKDEYGTELDGALQTIRSFV